MVNIAVNNHFMKPIISLLLVLFFFTEVQSQNAGIRAYAGISSAKNRVLAVTPNNHSHTGFHFGADGRLNGGKMFFVVGLRYTSLDLIATNESDFFGNTTEHTMLSGRVGLGWHLIQFGKMGSIRGKVLGQIDSHLNFDDSVLVTPYDDLVDASAGITAGLGVQLKFFVIDLEYEYGLVNQYSKQKETKSDVISLSIGFFF